MKKISILIPDGESYLLIYVINSLSQIKDIDIYIMSNQKYNYMRYSRHIHHFSFYPKVNDTKCWINNISNELTKYNIDVIMPIGELGIEALIKDKENLTSKDKLCLLPDFSNFKKADNKWDLVQHLSLNDIPFPKSIIYSKVDFLEIDKLNFPVISKPILDSDGGEGVCLFNDKVELQNYLFNNQFENKQIIQEYVKGYDIGCSVLSKSGNILAFTMQKATLVNTNPFRPLLGVKFVYEEDLYRIIEKLIKSLNWSGVAHIDLRYDVENKIFKVIEVNPRFWGSLDASLSAGVNFPYLYCLATLNKDFKPLKYKHIEFLNLKGLAISILKNIFLIFNVKFIMNNTPVKYALKDPLPTIFKYTNLIGKKFTNQNLEIN